MTTDPIAFFKVLLDIIPVAITGVDAQGIVNHWNASAADLYGISSEEILGKPLKEFFQEQDLVILNVLLNKTSVFRSYHRPRGDKHVLINAQPVYRSGKVIGAVASEQDITQLVNLYEDLAMANLNLERLKKAVENDSPNDAFEHIRGNSVSIQKIKHIAKKVALTDATILLTGESGVGKELFARAIHSASPRYKGPLIAINCGAIPPSLFESELFGYERGAFTGADSKGNPGKLALAQGGTLFLDEIGDLPLDLQVKLLRVLQEQSYFRLGGSIPLPVECRIMAATNRSLEKMVKDGTFREDLYFRLNVICLEIPPLRKRLEDIPILSEYFVQQFALQYRKLAPKLPPQIIKRLIEYSWPGNLRELKNVLERAVILCEGDNFSAEDLRFSPISPGTLIAQDQILTYVSDNNIPNILPNAGQLKKEIIQALQQAKGNKTKAARILGVSRATLYNRIQRFFPEG